MAPPQQSVKKGSAPPRDAVRQLRAVVVCRPPLPSDRLRLGECVTPSSVAAEDELLAICEPEAGLEAAAAAASPDADADACLLRDIGVGKDVHLRLPTYGWQGAPSSELCEREVAPLLQRLLGGESVAIVAYGMTGSGKSHTMGTEKCESGQAPWEGSVGSFCARRVFALGGEEGVTSLTVSCAAIEIYREGQNKEQLYDLLSVNRARIDNIEKQARWERVRGPAELQAKLMEASALRNTDRTDGNARSSRSHAAFLVEVHVERSSSSLAASSLATVAAAAGEGPAAAAAAAPVQQRLKARLMLVDLAGSERASLAHAGSTSQKQGSGINVGLLTLGLVIRELAEKGSTLFYSQSTLTRLLKPALGGGSNEFAASCNTLMLGCISPISRHLDNTRSTLEFLQQAGTVRNIVRPDVQTLRQHELEAQVESLQRQLRGMQLQLALQQKQHQQQQQHGATAGDAVQSSPPELQQQQQPDVPPPLADAAELQQLGGAAADGSGDALLLLRVAALERELAELQGEVAPLRVEAAVQRDRADTFEELLRHQAAAADAAATAAAAAVVGDVLAASPAAATPLTAGAAPPGPPDATPAPHSAAAAAAAAASVAAPRSSSAAASYLATTSPLLAASRDVALWAADTAAAERAATPAGQLVPLADLLPGAEQLCFLRESHMPPQALAALLDKVTKVLGGAESTAAAAGSGVHGGGERAYALAFAQAALFVAGTYNSCLGDAITAAEDAAEDLQADRQQHSREFKQIYEEKVQYMNLASAAERGLTLYDNQVAELKEQLAAAHEELVRLQQGTPKRWSSSLSRLITGSGRSPGTGGGSTPGGPATGDSFRTSHSASPPTTSPRVPQSGGGGDGAPSPSRTPLETHDQLPAAKYEEATTTVNHVVGEDAEAEAEGEAGTAGELRFTVAHVRRSSGGPPEDAAAAAEPASQADALEAALLAKQQHKALTQLLLAPGDAAADASTDADGSLIAAARPAPAAMPAVSPLGPAAAPEVVAQPQHHELEQAGEEDSAASVAVGTAPRVSVMVPQQRLGGSLLEAVYDPADDCFMSPRGSPADPLPAMGVEPGEPWQRRVLVKHSSNSALTVQHWMQRRTQRQGTCHFCCSAAPDPSCRHPEPALSQLQLCGECLAKLEPEAWKSGPGWVAPGDDDWLACCICANTGAGNPESVTLLYCDHCDGCGFCECCLWRFTDDDLQEIRREGATFRCPLCRPAPQLQLAFMQDDGGEGAGDHLSANKQQRQRQRQVDAGTPGQQRGGPGGGAWQQAAAAAAAATPAGFCIELDDGSPWGSASGSQGGSEQEEEEDEQQGPEEEGGSSYAASNGDSSEDVSSDGESDRWEPEQKRGRGKPAAVQQTQQRRRRRPAAATAAAPQLEAALEPAAAADLPAAAARLPAAAPSVVAAATTVAAPAAVERKRGRRLLPHGDVASGSPGEGGVGSPAIVRQRKELLARKVGVVAVGGGGGDGSGVVSVDTAAISRQRGAGQDYGEVTKRNPLWAPGRKAEAAQAAAAAAAKMRSLQLQGL